MEASDLLTVSVYNIIWGGGGEAGRGRQITRHRVSSVTTGEARSPEGRGLDATDPIRYIRCEEPGALAHEVLPEEDDVPQGCELRPGPHLGSPKRWA